MLMRQCFLEQTLKYPHDHPFLETDPMNHIKNGMQDRSLMQVSTQMFKASGKTFQANLMGKTILYTIDALKIQVAVALASEKSGVDPLRQATSSVWMGKGLFLPMARFGIVGEEHSSMYFTLLKSAVLRHLRYPFPGWFD